MAVAVLVLAAAAVAVVVATRSAHRESTVAFTHAQYVQSFDATVIGMKQSELRTWPPPYQTFTNQYREQCFEWWDKGHALYNLCFKNGLLALKAVE